MRTNSLGLTVLLSLLLVCTIVSVSFALSNLIVVRAADDSLWKSTCDGSTCTGFTSFPGRFRQQPTVTYDEVLAAWVIVGVASDNTIWRATFDYLGNFNNDWARIPGSTPSPVGMSGLYPAGVSPNQECPQGSYMVGIDASGNIECSVKHVFVSSTTVVGGSLGSVDAADKECATLASDANLKGKFRAWMSSTVDSPGSSFTRSSVPYVLTNGTKIADNWSDLRDGSLDAPINVDERKYVIGAVGIWTGTGADGALLASYEGSGPNCSDWTSMSGFGYSGSSSATNASWSGIYGSNLILCANPLHLYCFEQ